MLCVKTAILSFIINGEPHGFVKPRKGLRQGDPISPYPFLFCAQALSCLLNCAAVERRIWGHQVCSGAPAVSYLLFADDSLVFCNATIEQA